MSTTMTRPIWTRSICESLPHPSRALQAAKNHHAVLAARVLARLSGSLDAPRHEAASAALAALLTSQLAGRLGAADPRPLLRDLNRSVATPTVRRGIVMTAGMGRGSEVIGSYSRGQCH